jgi:glutamate racemase
MNPSEAPKILVFDSGLGGLSVLAALREKLPGADYFYLGDDALFPYGKLAPEVLVARVEDVIAKAMVRFAADCIVIACNTASTLVLPPLRARYNVPIVGTVPPIKPAAEKTGSGLVSVLATPGTVSRNYTADLVRNFAMGVDVTLVGAPRLAELAERVLRGEAVPDAEISEEIAPAFVSVVEEGEVRRTDIIVLGCTHYPLIQSRMETLAPWAVEWIDPAPAIARRVAHLLGECGAAGQGSGQICLTAGSATGPALSKSLLDFGLTKNIEI